jgi:hypothetical protein
MHVKYLFKLIRSNGVIHDFAGSETISVDNFTFGEPHKYVQLALTEEEKIKWDEAVKSSDLKFSKEDHNLFLYFQSLLIYS